MAAFVLSGIDPASLQPLFDLDDAGLADDLFALQAEQQHQCRQQRDERPRSQRPQHLVQPRLASVRQQRAPPKLRHDHRDDDVQSDRQ